MWWSGRRKNAASGAACLSITGLGIKLSFVRDPAIIGESPSQPEPARTEKPKQSVPMPVAQREIGGRDGPDPTRYGDWEKNGRCIDF
nr:succinate dehydrogenase assembly factor 4 [Luteimonas aquatica]